LIKKFNKGKCVLQIFQKLMLLALVLGWAMPDSARADAKPKPNILFVMTDDIGIDQYAAFGYGGAPDEQAKTPILDTLSKAGLRFANTWSHPSCGPSRASVMLGRYNIRTGMLTAPAPGDLPNSQVSPYEFTIPRILRKAGYVSAVFGKMHLSTYTGDSANLPFMNETMRKLGFDYFEGYLEGGPSPIDTTAGGIGGTGTYGNGKVYGCGFIPATQDNADLGADSGACYQADGGCTVLTTPYVRTPGRSCMEQGGILVPNAQCGTMPGYLNFSKQNGHYTGNWVLNKLDGTTELQPPQDPRARGFKLSQEVTRAANWIKQQPKGKPWMVSVGMSTMHEPVQPTPTSLVPDGSPETGGYSCTSSAETREMATQMAEAADKELGRLLVEANLATYRSDGSLNYDPQKTNTYVIFTSDNGTWNTSVRTPFDPERSKGTAYQTGVWVPLVVTGPNIVKPGQRLEYLVNLSDLFSFFGEIAGIDVKRVVPKSHVLDSEKMMAYLTHPYAQPIRRLNFALQGNNIRSSNAVSHPCVIPSVGQCTYSLPSESVCRDQGGTWYGDLTSCCQVPEVQAGTYLSSVESKAIRNARYKLFQQVAENCSNGEALATNTTYNEFYEVNQAVPEPKLDRAEVNLIANGLGSLTLEQRRNYNFLLMSMNRLEASVIPCPGDVNLDMRVNQKDLQAWESFASTTPGEATQNGGGKGSWADFGGPADATHPDGLTDSYDRAIILANYGKVCR
jgi:hypothetical protein